MTFCVTAGRRSLIFHFFQDNLGDSLIQQYHPGALHVASSKGLRNERLRQAHSQLNAFLPLTGTSINMNAGLVVRHVYIALQFLKDWSKHVADMLDITSLKTVFVPCYVIFSGDSRPEALGRLPQLLYSL